MKAAVLHGKQDLRIGEVDEPVPDIGEVLLRVACVGVCGTDHAEWWNGPRMFPVLQQHPVTGHVGPMIMGHEFSGVVESCGPGVSEDWGGRRVVSSAAVSCGDCIHCRGGRSNLCHVYYGIGLHRDGALAQYVTVPTSALLDITDSPLTLDEGALAQPMAIAHHAVRRGDPQHQSTIIVQGVGGIGAFIVRVLAELGHRVIAVDLDELRLQIATAMGAEVVVFAVGEQDEVAAELRSLIRTYSVELAFEVSGSAPGLEVLRSSLGMGARIVLVGIQKGGQTSDLGSVTTREQELIGTNGLVHARDLPAAVRSLEKIAGNWALVAPVVHPLAAQLGGILEQMATGANLRPIKALIDPWSLDARTLA